ncbi:TlyA family RNA methyltransferase [Senegalia massiliensis]|uniref:TlyA family RNA methyltransferase n=1 Tax=Senegalia massiliensis TaxID=1720316 RepID=A0A845QXW4_9CLOT|nr:TlyA family RNA methyltransferase [Senegalia massiliensis]NBI06639.1 TlyA family RNA methyltransferase [Senegalia massiliensis]
MELKRIDILLKEKGLVKSRELAQKAISKKIVKYNGTFIKKASMKVPINANLELIDEPLKYVSRAGYKLEKAINTFNIDLKNKIAIDMGASTGGFTDCMLQNGIKKVYSIDVGHSQLDEKLINNSKVINMENINIRYLDLNKIEDDIDFISIDVSFISITKILNVAEKLLNNDGKIVALIKPQFEIGRQFLGKKAIVKDKKYHLKAVNTIKDFLKTTKLNLVDIDYSPIKGSRGNIEFLALISTSNPTFDIDKKIKEIINNSHISNY